MLTINDEDSYDVIDKGYMVAQDVAVKIWRNSAGQIHRDGDHPAIIRSDGVIYYCKSGKLHRDDGKPAVIHSDGTGECWINGMFQ